MCDSLQYNSVLFAEDIQNSAYQLPALVQQYLRRARAFRIELVNEAVEEKNARLRHSVQWLVASMAYAIRPRTDEQRFMVLTRVLMADNSLQAIMDTVETGTFIPDDWIAMFGLLTDELSFKEYGDLVQGIFKPFVGWMESRPSAILINAITPTLAASVEAIEPPPLFLNSPGVSAVNAHSAMKLKRARSFSPSMAEMHSSKRLKVSDEGALPSSDGGCEKAVLSLKVTAATHPSVSMKAGSSHTSDAASLAPVIALTPAVWHVSSSSPLATQLPRFSSPDNLLPLSDSVSVCSRTQRKEEKSVAVYSRSKFIPSKKSSSSTFPVDKPVAAGKLGSSSKSVVLGRLETTSKTVAKFVPSRTPVSSVESGSSSKSGSFTESVSFSKSVSSRKTVPSNWSSKFANSNKFTSSSESASWSKSATSSGRSDVCSSQSALSSKPVNPGKFIPSKRKSGSYSSSIPSTPQPNHLNLQRRLIIISPPPRLRKSTH